MELDKFKHFEINSSKVEKLIEMWKYFHPKDDPQPLTNHSIRIDDKHPDVANHAFMEVLKYKVYDESYHKIDRWQVRTQSIRSADPVDLMYERFIEVKSGGVHAPRKSTIDTLADAEETDSKSPRKKKAA